MIADASTWRAAAQMMKLYGADAAAIGLMQAELMLQEGATEGSDNWELIVAAICDLRREAPEPGQYLN